MKNFYITITFILLSSIAFSQSANWQWAQGVGGLSSDVAYCVATDADGNVYMAGEFYSNSITIGTNTFSNAGLSDIFLVKYDAAGNVLWARHAGGSLYDVVFSVATDPAGNVYITGYFQSNNITFGTTNLINSIGADVYLAKYDASGNMLWVENRGTNYTFRGVSLAIDASGNIYVGGIFNGTLTNFGGSTFTTNGGFDIFVLKYSAAGNELSAINIGGIGDEDIGSIAVDTFGNLFITGNYESDTMSIGNTTLTNAGLGDIFLAKYDSGGNPLWAKSAGGIGSESGKSVATDVGGNAYVSGFFQAGNIAFGANTIINGGSRDKLLLKYDANGNELWWKNEGGINNQDASAVTTDQAGNVYETGYFENSITFGTSTLSSLGYRDIYTVKYDSTGNVLWAIAAGGTSVDATYSIAVDTSQNVYVAGSFYNVSATFGSITLPNEGDYDMFIAKIDSSQITVGNNEINKVDSRVDIYPNPTNGQFIVSQYKNTKIEIEIHNLLGELIYKTTLSSQQTTIDLANEAKGIYFINVVENSKKVTNKKVIIQ